ncbi:alkaline phosphatase family protein [Microbacterium keratanolyticum]
MPRFRRALGATSTTLIAAGLAVAAPSAAQAAEYKELPDGTHTTKTLVIGIDGASFDFMAPEAMPNLTSLRTNGMTAVSNLFANPMAGTISGAGWSTIATGVWPDKHNVVDNSFADPHYDEYPDYLTRIEAADPAASNLVVGTWGPISQQVFGPAVDLRVAGGNDAGTTQTVVDYLSAGNPDNVFVHLDEVDGAGHSVGTNGPAYAEALQRADAQIGEMLAAIEARATAASEDWLVVVTSDHGHRPTGGHGGNTAAERRTFVIAAGAGIPAGVERHDTKLVEIAPMVLQANGISIDGGWDLDGHTIDTLVADDFDALRPVLRTQVDETRPGASTLGWTNETPEGWSIDNSRMPAGGVTEWSGWSFATDEFWTGVEAGQMRETSVRNRDVFAVADSDEWDDRPHAPGPFDSTLNSPAWALNGAATATLSYATNYFIDGPQTADVRVSFDGGEPQSLKTYKVDTNRVENLSFDVPAGAETAQVSFHYTGQNSAFWTIDQVVLVQEEPPAPIVPPAPTGLSVIAGDGSLRASWQASVSEVDVTGYTVTAVPVVEVHARAESATCTTTGETTCEILGLRNGTPYSVTVRAHGAEGDSVESAAFGPVTPVAEEPETPGAETPGTETPGTETPGTGTPGGEGSGAGGSTGTSGSDTGSLATTGADPLPLILLGSGVLVVGALATVVGLRRRTAMDIVE